MEFPGHDVRRPAAEEFPVEKFLRLRRPPGFGRALAEVSQVLVIQYAPPIEVMRSRSTMAIGGRATVARDLNSPHAPTPSLNPPMAWNRVSGWKRGGCGSVLMHQGQEVRAGITPWFTELGNPRATSELLRRGISLTRGPHAAATADTMQPRLVREVNPTDKLGPRVTDPKRSG
jgi:hypothetical protein